ncbi:succinate dehydrogenase hydrophobic membrane anchor subunit [Streptomyces sp. HNM0575]|uniref:succinate dehydrogenase hydrophobic membrane anchor subunit n=1 Tax=Streptomyces sp. HNM0575 TaxID=2716338 RepID=UPI00145E32A5|nr:succinate dehydrogenase hydrophobic membrane anchor subunit [Streptomyces sp. HNM0575]NLU72315.1 succinate dehydrogenase hydrophobic membrane anchor subunit [Streptomyces sp. HNM0575]
MSTETANASSSSSSSSSEGGGYSAENPAPVIVPARSRTTRTPKTTRTNFELYGWLFMRLSGIVLVVLVIGHLLIQLVLEGGVSKISFAFVAGRWASPFWQVWDLMMLWLAMLHGANGLRTVINDYAERDATRLWLKALLYTATVFTVLLGTLVIFTFDPNIR